MTEALPWNETFSVGHRELDAEHHRMVDLINQICLACGTSRRAQKSLALLRDLEILTKWHFAHEEMLLQALHAATPKERRTLRDMQATAKVKHAIEHRRRLDELHHMVRALHADEAVAAAKLCDELKAWFVDHAIGYEAQMKTIMQSI